VKITIHSSVLIQELFGDGMNKELEQKILDRWSDWFDTKNPQHSLMCFGFAHDDGWFGIIWKMCEDIEKVLHGGNRQKIEEVEAKLDHKRYFEFIQIKEKFGTLRVYHEGSYPQELVQHVRDIISRAEAESRVTCEECGRPGKTRNDRWIKTLCDNCATTKEVA